MKEVVFESEFQEFVGVPGVGKIFVNGEPVPVTDEQAALLTETFPNEYLEGPASEVEKLAVNGRRYRGTRNPMFGNQKHPNFRIVESEDPAPKTVPPPVSPVGSRVPEPVKPASAEAASAA